MRIALDASYSIDKQPSGIAVYSRELLTGLAATYPTDTFLRYYRWKQWRQTEPAGRHLLAPYVPIKADLFHALNQRLDSRPARRVVTTFHDLFVMTGEYSSPDFRRRFGKQARRAAERSDLIIAVSDFTASQVHELLGVERSRLRIVRHGTRPVLPVPAAPPPNRNIVLSVGAIQQRKNTARLVEAFEAMPEDWRLILAGSPSGYGANDILERIERSPARARIAVKGYVATNAELSALYASATIFAFPSLDEGFGIPVLEAMAQGVPVLTSNRSALPEVAGGAALLIDPLRVDEIADGLHRLAFDAALRARLREAGLARAGELSWERAVAATYRVYQEATL